MAGNQVPRALVVEDELIVQRLVQRALVQQGFNCDAASNRAEAEEKLAAAQYDVVLVDLRLPNGHGHGLAMQLLATEHRPAIVIHTGVHEPRLAKDLLARGVDDVVFKPFDLSVLAAKVKAVVNRRCAARQSALAAGEASSLPRVVLPEVAADSPDSSASTPNGKLTASNSSPGVSGSDADSPEAGASVSLSDINSKLADLASILPISKAALDVYEMTSAARTEAPQVAAAIQRDATLAAEVLRLANSAFYNLSGQRVVQLERAVVQVGQKRIGELALATNALAALTSTRIPWMDLETLWKRSMAAGIAAEMLIEEGKHQAIETGLMLSEIMQPVGRVVLATLYPKRYERMILQCESNLESLQDQERHTFPLTHTEIMSHLLGVWNVPDDVRLPLRFALDDYTSLLRLSEPVRLRAELVKLAVLFGCLAVEAWSPWDLVDFPPTTLLRRIGLDPMPELLAHIKTDVRVLATFARITANRRCRPWAQTSRGSWPIAIFPTRLSIS